MYKKQHFPELRLLPTQDPANPPSRKRQIDSNRDTDNKSQLKRARLTQRNLARFNKMQQRKQKESKKPSCSHCDSTSGPQKTKTTSTTTSGFADQVTNNGILAPLHSRAPKNLEEIQRRYTKPRKTPPPTKSKFNSYARDVEKAGNEITMVVETSSYLLKKYEDDEGYIRGFNKSFSGFPNDVGFNNKLSAPQPDFVEGLDKGEYNPFLVGNYIRGAVLYKDDPYSITLPHIAGEWKGRAGDTGKARLQSSYNGAALVYARNQALSLMGRSDPPGHAKVTTFTTDGTTLNQYAHYAEELEDGTTNYHQYRVQSINLVNSHQEFKDGRRCFRNAQDYAREQSYALRDDLREYYKRHRSTLQPIGHSSSEDSSAKDSSAKSSHQVSSSYES